MALPIAAAAKVVGQRLARRVVGRNKRPRRKKNHLGLWIFVGFVGFVAFIQISMLLSLATMGGGGTTAAIAQNEICDTTIQVGNTTPGPGGLGEMPTSISASPGGPVSGTVTIANANIKLRSGATPGIRALVGPSPDFITLNEVADVPLSQMREAAPGYDAYRDETRDQGPGTGGGLRGLDNAIMWRTDTWSRLDGGNVKIVDQDQTIFQGKQVSWNRYATWGVFQRTDGAIVSVISTHHMTNVYKFPKQWGNPSMSRAEQYGLGMDYLIDLAAILRAYGPVFVGGDMNSHPNDGPNAAAPKMAAAGYDYTKDSGVIYNFYAAPVTVQRTWEISKAAVHSDHPALFTKMAMNGAAPNGDTPGSDDNGSSGDATDVSDTSEGCVCPTAGSGYTGEGTKVATFNILGASHTDGKGGGSGRGSQEHKGYYPDHTWDKRLPEALSLLETHGVSIAGLQEVHAPQGRALANNSEWDVWPTSGTANKVLWDPDQWQMTDHRLPQIQYFNGTVGMPIVKLTSQNGEGSVWVMSVHNPIGPVSTRAADLRQELELARQLSADGTPFLLVGDFNDGKDGNQDAKSILTPTLSDAGTQAPIDHIFGTGVTFTGTETDGSTKSQKISDHPLAMATFTAQGSEGTPAITNVSATSTMAGCTCPTTGTGTGTGNANWPAGTVAGSDDAIRATHAILLAVGFNEQDALLMTAIAGPESGWNPDAEAPGSSATGLFQVLQSHDPSANLHDPVVNARWAKKLFDASGNANPWQGWPESPLSYPPWVTMATHNTIERNFNEAKARVERVLGASVTPTGSTGETCNVSDTPGGVSGDLLNRLRQRAEMVIALSKKYPGGPGCVPGFNDQGVFPCGSGWGSACTAISMMIYGNNYVGSGSGGERAYGSVVQGQQGSSWPPPPGAIVSWPYSGNGHVSIYLGDGQWVDNWPDVGHQTHTQVEQGATAHWLLPPPSFEGTFLNNGTPA